MSVSILSVCFDLQYFVHNFEKFKYITVVFGKQHRESIARALDVIKLISAVMSHNDGSSGYKMADFLHLLFISPVNIQSL